MSCVRYCCCRCSPFLPPPGRRTSAPPLPAPSSSVYAALDRGDFRAAYLQWNDEGRASGKSYAAFRQGFAATARTRVTTGAPTDGDAGMSQRWITVPVDVHAVLKDGRRQHFMGSYTLHRVVAGVGGPLRDRSWHIASAKLRQVR